MTIKQQTEASVASSLRDGGTTTIRPLEQDDRAALLAFGAGLPPDDWVYLEDDFQSPDLINRLVNAHAAENWRQLVAVVDGAIVGYSAARRLPGWSSHVADIRLLVDCHWRRKGLGTALARAIVDAACTLGADKVIVEVLEEQTASQEIFAGLGFHVEGSLGDHARDRQGRRHKLLIMAYHIHRHQAGR